MSWLDLLLLAPLLCGATTVLLGDCRRTLATLPDESVHCVVTSPPYLGLRDYGAAGQIGLEATPAAFVAELVAVFREVRRVLRPDGTLWLNLGDSYCSDDKWGGRSGGIADRAGINGRGKSLHPRHRREPSGFKPKDRMMIPARVAIALSDDGWWLRDEIVWSKPNPMPSSVRDRTTPAHEMVYLLTKSARYFYDGDAIAEPITEASAVRLAQDVERQAGSRRANGGVREDRPFRAAAGGWRRNGERLVSHEAWKGRHAGYQSDGWRNKRSVWEIATQPFADAHFATFPPALVEPMVLAGCPAGGMVLDPFGGAGTTALVANRLGRDAVLCEVNPDYAELAAKRLEGDAGLFAGVTIQDLREPAEAA